MPPMADPVFARLVEFYKMCAKQHTFTHFGLLGGVQQLDKEIAFPVEQDQRLALQTGKLGARRIYVAGVAGTGKTRLINAIRQLFKEHGRGDWLQTCANMGLAAFLIGGRTVASLIGARGSPEEVDGVGKEQR